ncbi:juvenile hormone epoxide hydrolase-like [Maniola jurtina]|uniref:juvenile hormone epoxide hydrolase-like n=1 Tax=Maniola jurtina TaxID=191418 RepID=UPI001E68ABA5|nr:juvenile hormone epoxide hydrolase-like [Maniola jurtina]
MAKFLFVVSLALISVGIWLFLNAQTPGFPPQLDPNEWWGPLELRGKTDASIKPFEIRFGQEMIRDLKERLKNHREVMPPLEDVGFEYGFNSKQLDPWVKYWAEEYKFQEREKFFNKFPQFKTNIQGLDIHFIRVKPQVPAGVTTVPLLLMHGWPGSVREFYEAIPLLTKKADGYDFVFEVIVPSLPGYGFSDAAVRPGLGAGQMGVIFKNLMNRLGHKQYYVQGGDWGAGIGSSMATMFQNEVLGFHSNMLFVQNGWTSFKTMIGAFFPSLVVEPHLADRMYPLSRYFAYVLEEFGYFHLQATKPDTVGVALSDSPSGLLAYILEKFSTWTRFEHRSLKDGGLSYRFSKEQLIDNLMVYWSTNSITTSMRLYAETMSNKNRALGIDGYTTTVPTWALQAKNELFYQPPNILSSKFSNLLGVTVLDHGGHFLAFELPELFAKDVYKAVKAFKDSMMFRILLAVLVALVAVILVPLSYLYLKPAPPLPDIDLHEWWGSEILKDSVTEEIKPFKVQFSESMVKDLKERLRDRHPLAPPLEGVAFEYGFNSKQLETWLKYWAEEYPFRERENFFNKYPHFKTNIQGLDIHFIRVKPNVPAGTEVVPLLLLHGWPGSVREFYEAIPLLTAVSKDRNFAIELIVPSLPGYGFSSAAVRAGLGADKMAVVIRNLMQRLGFKKYYVQGGDWGSLIGKLMATFFPEEILGYHTNMPFPMSPWYTISTVLGSIFPSLVISADLQDRMYPLSKIYSNLLEETGYMHLQSTKPDTIGVALSDSPAGLAAYMLEKFSTWTRKQHRNLQDGGLTYRFTKDQLLDNVMVYFSTNSMTSAMRLYAESFNARYASLRLDEIPSPVPTISIQAKNELFYAPTWAITKKFPNLIRNTALGDGGHFLAFELPELFAKDVLKAIGEFRAWHKNNKTEL